MCKCVHVCIYAGVRVVHACGHSQGAMHYSATSNSAASRILHLSTTLLLCAGSLFYSLMPCCLCCACVSRGCNSIHVHY